MQSRTRTLAGMAVGVVAAVMACGTAHAQTDVAMMEIEGSLAEQPSPMAWLEASGSFGTLADVVAALHEVAEDSQTDALVIRLKDAALTTSQIQEIGAALAEIRAAGKRVHVFAENYGNGELMLGSYADEAILQAGGMVSLSGLYMQEMFLKDALNWIGIKADFVQIGDYKGANEMYMNSGPSEPWDQNINQLLDSIYDGMRSTLKDNLSLSDAQLDAAMEAGWLSGGEDAIESGLIDAVVDLPMLTEHLEEVYGDEIAWSDVEPSTSTALDPANPFAMLRMLTTPPDHSPKGETIAVLHIVGTIIDGDSTSGGLLGGESVGSRTIRRALEDILAEDLIKGVVVRIDSPGGSAIASEVMWQGMQRVAAEKPVWVSIGSMAASGGYYTAVGGEKIYANPSSIVGSIGVVGGKFSMGELYEKLHVNIVSRSRGPRSGLFSTVTPWNESDRAFVRAKMTETYDLFVSRVKAGRPGIDISSTAEGRLFTGDRAIGLGMIDELGSLDDAVTDLAASLDMTRYDVMNYPGPKGFDEIIGEMLGGFMHSPVRSELAIASAVRELLGDRAWRQVSNAGRALLNFRDEPVQAVMPQVMLFD
ncbi:MAG: S49 family peptidase [Planctomycetota bacterium]|nr:S49 family peptidase [Planctomycetota bacterium]